MSPARTAEQTLLAWYRVASYEHWAESFASRPTGAALGLLGLAHDLEFRWRRGCTLADDADLLDQLERAVQISVSDCISRENREFFYFSTVSLREASLGDWW